MAKTVKKKAPAKKAMAKPAPKKAAAPKAEPVKKVAKPAPQQEEPGSFMWRLLKKKEAERKRLQEERKNSKFNMNSANSPQLPTGNQGFGRFHGPRRKAA
jgi:hypothetical protein